MTRVSQRMELWAGIRRRSRALARLSLYFAAMAPALTGCFDPTPEYTVPDPVPPVIDVSDTKPATTIVYSTNTESVNFNVPFRADDAGETLLAYFIPDIPPRAKPPIANLEPVIPDPRPFAEQTGRAVTFNWNWYNPPTLDVGCHTMTMILARASNIVTTAGVVDVVDPLEAAQVTWFLALSRASQQADCASWPNASTGNTQ